MRLSWGLLCSAEGWELCVVTGILQKGVSKQRWVREKESVPGRGPREGSCVEVWACVWGRTQREKLPVVSNYQS